MPKAYAQYTFSESSFSYNLAENNDGDIRFKGVASSTDENRYGDVIEASFWTRQTINGYLKNPVLLYSHNYDDPVGTIEKATFDKDAGRLSVEGVIFNEWEKAYLIERGAIRSLSVGISIDDAKPRDPDDVWGGLSIRKGEWLETSLATVPADRNAQIKISNSLSFDTNDRRAVVKQFTGMNFLENVAEVLAKKLGITKPQELTEEGVLDAIEGFDLNATVENAVNEALKTYKPQTPPAAELTFELGDDEKFKALAAKVEQLGSDLATKQEKIGTLETELATVKSGMGYPQTKPDGSELNAPEGYKQLQDFGKRAGTFQLGVQKKFD